MHLFQAIIRNISLLKYHILYFLLKYLIIFAAFRPLQKIFERYLQSKPVNHDLFNYSDSNIIFEFFNYILKTELDSMISASLIVFLVYILIDLIFEMAFFRSYSKKDHSDFFSGINHKLGQFFLLKLLAIIPYSIMIFLYSFILFTVYVENPANFWLLGTVFIALSPLLFLVLKIIDWAKIDLLKSKDSFLKAIGQSIITMFRNFKDVLLLNLKVALFIAIGAMIYFFIDSVVTVDSGFTVFVMTIVFELFVFLKQVLRYSYSGSIIQIYEESVIENERKIQEKETVKIDFEIDES